MTKLNPCGDALIAAALRGAAPGAARLLDVACGRGDRLRMLADTWPGLALCGLDADADNAATAARRCPEAAITVGDAAALPWGDGAFDAALCECSFSLFSAPARCAGELARVLASGGVLLLGDLYVRRDAAALCPIAGGETVKTVYGRDVLERFFIRAGLRVAAFSDRSGDLTQLLGQMLMDGALCDCLNAAALRQMKQIGTGYGLWIFRK